ncbi:MAG: MFS transporter [Pseudomonadota bacterium]|nr:MFS transporter [Pseudomonadota bacterium]
MGDVLLYVALPLYATVFGVTLVWVGILLAANRLVRIVGYSFIARLGHRVGLRYLSLASGVAAAVSTLAYGYGSGEYVLLIARLVWGMSFAALNLSVLAYATKASKKLGMRVGLGRMLAGIGPTLSLSFGAWLITQIGPRDVFILWGFLTWATIPLAWFLPDLENAEEQPRKIFLPRPDHIDLWGFVMGLVVDGIFVLTLMIILKDNLSLESAVLSGGLILALRRAVEMILGLFGGNIGDRFGAAPTAFLFTVTTGIGLAMIAWGWLIPGAIIVVLSRGLSIPLGPVLVAQRYPNQKFVKLAAYSTWTDVGAAVGPLVAGLLVQSVSTNILYAVLAASILATLILIILSKTISP